MSGRLALVAAHVPGLLEVYFDVLIAYGDEAHLKELVPVLFDRLEQVCTHACTALTTHPKGFIRHIQMNAAM